MPHHRRKWSMRLLRPAGLELAKTGAATTSTTPQTAVMSPVSAGSDDTELLSQVVRMLAGEFAISSLQSLLGAGADIAGAAVKALLELEGMPRLLKPDPVPLATAPIRAMHRQNLLRRGAYLINAARRISAGIRQGRTLDAVSSEQGYLRQHLEANAKRNEAAQAVAQQVRQHGSMLLGWYSVRDERTSPECRAAHGRNFRAERIPLIGFPGTVHVHCRCRPGPAHSDAAMLAGSPAPVMQEIAASVQSGRERALQVLELSRRFAATAQYLDLPEITGRHRRPDPEETIELAKSSTYPDLERVPGKQNWVDKAGGLPSYIERIAKHLHYEKGMDISRAIATAVSTVKRWAAGGDNVTAQTRAKAVKAVAEWEAKKAKSRG